MATAPELPVTKAEIDATFRKVTWRIVPLLMICYVLAFIDRGNVGFSKLQFMGDLGVNEAVYGLGGGLFYLGCSVFEVPSNLLLARVGVRLTLLRIMVLWGLAPRRWRYGLALALLHPAFAILRSLDGVLGLKGWQWLFISEGVPPAIMGVVAYFTLPDRPETAHRLNFRQVRIITAELEAEQLRDGVAGPPPLRPAGHVDWPDRRGRGHPALAADHHPPGRRHERLVHRPDRGGSLHRRDLRPASDRPALGPDAGTALALGPAHARMRAGLAAAGRVRRRSLDFPRSPDPDDGRLPGRDGALLDDARIVIVRCRRHRWHRHDHHRRRHRRILRAHNRWLDRLIAFAGLTMSRNLGLTATMFGLCVSIFYVG